MVIDFHIHPFLFNVNEKMILEAINKAQVSHAVLLTPDYAVRDYDNPKVIKKIEELTKSSESIFDWTAEKVIYFLKRMALEREKQKREERVLKLISKFPGRFTWFGSVNPNRSEDEIKTKLKNLKKLGVRGLKFLPTFQVFNPATCDNFKTICDFCAKNNWIILIHTGCDPGPFEVPEIAKFANPENLIPVIEEYDNLKFVLAHMGSYSAFKMGIWLKEALNILYKYDNAYADTSAVNYFVFNNKDIVNMIRKVLDKIVFGSDFPSIAGSDIAYEVLAVRRSPYLTNDEKLKILRLNAVKILNLKI